MRNTEFLDNPLKRRKWVLLSKVWMQIRQQEQMGLWPNTVSFNIF